MTAILARPRRPAAAPPADAAPTALLRNLGPASARMLAAAGITTPAQLRRLGAVAAYARVKRADPGASLNLLYALEGALQGVHWQTVRRLHRLELLTALEDLARTQARPARIGSDLPGLRNIGPAMKRDFDLLGIRSCAQLARADADRLYVRLQRLTGARQDPCVWDTFAAAIHQARTGEALPWWHFTRERKRRQAEGTFVAVPALAGGAPAKRTPPAPRSRVARLGARSTPRR